MVKLSIVISYYRALDNLQLILMALNKQSDMDFEVIVSEDDNAAETIVFLDDIKQTLKYPIQHVHQKADVGFRKNEMLNKAICVANSEKMAFIDGDCIPHKHFAKQYILEIEKNSFCAGRSVFLDKKTSEIMKSSKSLKKLNLFSLLFSGASSLKEGIYFPFFSLSIKAKGLVGRNWGCHRKDLIEINGFDEDYIQAGVGEDSDIEWRLLKNGAKRKLIKNKAIVYHLYHDRWYSDEIERDNYKMMQEKMQKNQVRCLNGIEKINTEKNN